MTCIDCKYWSPEELAKDYNEHNEAFGYCMRNINDRGGMYAPFHPARFAPKPVPIYYSFGKLKPIQVIVKQFFTLYLRRYFKYKFDMIRFKRNRKYIYTDSNFGCNRFKKR